MPLSLPALMVMRSPGAKMRCTNDSWLPVTRIGVGGASNDSFGAQASSSTSGGSFTGAGRRRALCQNGQPTSHHRGGHQGRGCERLLECHRPHR